MALCSACAAAEEAPTEESAGSGESSSGGSSANGTSGNAVTSGSGGSASTGATGGGGSIDCVYPSGPFGVHQGEIVDAAAVWQGFAPGADVPVQITPADYFDCDGSRGINALVVLQSATWCGPCQLEASALEAKIAGGWSALGVEVITLMVEQQPEQPATVDTAQAWKNQFGLTSVAVAADPAFTFDAFDYDQHIPHSGFPTQLLIDPRTMTIAVRMDGDTSIDAQVEQLAKDNQ